MAMKKETEGSKFSLSFSSNPTHLKYDRLFQKRSVCAQFRLFMSVEYTFFTFGRGVAKPTATPMPLPQARCADICNTQCVSAPPFSLWFIRQRHLNLRCITFIIDTYIRIVVDWYRRRKTEGLEKNMNVFPFLYHRYYVNCAGIEPVLSHWETGDWPAESWQRPYYFRGL